MIDRLALGVAVLGALACIGVHVAAYLDIAAGFGVAAVLMGGAMLAWGRGLASARAAFRSTDARALWTGVTKFCPWLRYTFHPLVLYFAVFWAWAIYVAMVQRGTLSPKLWALFFSAGAGTFYAASLAFLLAAGRARTAGS